MTTTRRRVGRLFGLNLCIAACFAAGSALAAPGDPIGTIGNVALGGVNDQNPYFKDFNSPRGMATLTGGNVVVVWSARPDTSAPNPTPDSPDGTNGASNGAFFRVFDPNGAPVTPVTRPYLDVNAAGTGPQNDTMVAALSGGGFVMLWTSAGGPGDAAFEDVYGRVFSSTGASVSATFKVNDLSTADEETPQAVVGLTGGGFAVVWKDESNTTGNTDDYFLRVYNASGVPQAASVELGGAAHDGFFKDFDSFNSRDGLVALSNGNVAVSWGVRDTAFDGSGTGAEGAAPGGWAGLIQVFNASGADVSGIITPYIDINANRSGHQAQPRLAALSGGGFAATWNSNNNTDDGGNSDTGAGGNSTSGGDTYTRVFNGTGGGVSTTARVNDVSTDDEENPSAIVPLTGGGYAITWFDQDQVSGGNTDDFYVRAFTAAGASAGGSLRIGGAGADPLFEDYNGPRGLVPLSDGGFVAAVSVRDNNNGIGTSIDGPGNAAVVQVFNANGSSRVAPFFPYADINPDRSGNQNIPQLAQVSGGFAVTWNSTGNTNDGGNNDVFAGSTPTTGGDTWTRLYNNAGAAVHATVKVHNVEPTGVDDEQRPAFLVPAGANYVVLIRDENSNTSLNGTAESNKDDLFIRAFGDAVATNPDIAVEQPAATGIADGGSRDFGAVNVGSNTSLTFTIRNSGAANLTGLTITLDGANSSEFSVTANPTAPVAPAGTTTFTVQFAPTGTGVRTAALHIASNDPDENPYDITITGTGVGVPEIAVEQPAATGIADGGSRDFGSVNLGSNTSLTFTIRNSGSGNLTGLVITKDGANSADFTVTANPTAPVAPAGTTTFTVQFAPAAAGARTAAIHIASNDADENPYDITLTGTGVAVPEIGVEQPAATGIADGGSRDFGSVNIGSNTSLTFTIRNSGTANLTGLTITQDGANSAEFSVTANPTAPLAPAGTTTFTVQFAPTGAGVRTAAIHIASNDADENPYDITITGTGVAVPEIAVEQPALTNIADGGSRDFGSVNMGSNTSLTFTIRNPGSANLTGLVITKDGAHPGDFVVTANPAAPVAPAGTTTFTVQFTPSAAGARSAALHIASNDADENPFDITVTGTGVTLPVLTIGDVTVTEGDSGTLTANFAVSLDIPALAGGVTFDIGTAPNSATAPSDYATNSLAGQAIAAGNNSYAFAVTVNGDELDELDETYFVNVTNVSGATVGDGQGQGTITDDDTRGISVTPTNGLVTTEAGGTATFTVVLDSQPTADVTVGLSSSDSTEGTVSPPSLVFTSANWNSARTVTVTGANDPVDDGDVAYSVLTAAATGGDYAGLDAADVALTNTDDDTLGVTVSPTAGLTTTEAGGMATFTVRLDSQPAADVTIALSSSNTNEGTVAPASLTFTAGNFATPQTVTVTGANDAVDDGDIAYSIVTGTTSSADPTYNGLAVADVSLSNTDDDGAGILVNPTAGLSTTEAGGTATFTVVLSSQPTADVTIGLASSDTTEGTVAPASLLFTPANWNLARTVTVTGANDALDDGDIAYTVITAVATSADPNYGGIDPADVALGNADDDGVGILVNPTAGLSTTEAAGTATFTVVLSSEPTADVVIGLSSTDTTEGTVAPPTLTFTAANWNVPRTVTVTGVDDAVDDGDIAYTVVTAAATSGDAGYAGINPADVALSNTDNDGVGIVVTPTAGLGTTEAGGSAAFTVVLSSQPTADVTIGLSSGDTTEGTVAPATLTFTAANWNMVRTVTVTGVDDAIDDGDVAYTIATAAAVSTDPGYSGVDASNVQVTNVDNDGAGIIVTPLSGLVTTEAGGTATFSVVLGSQPTADVTIALSSSDTTEGTVAPAQLVFTTANWSVAQTVTVTGADDVSYDGNVAYSAVRAAAVSADPVYQGFAGGNVGVTNNDNDTNRLDGTTATGSGAASVVIAGGECGLDLAQSSFIPTTGLQLPPEIAFPHGALRLRAQGCTPGASLVVSVTWPSLPAVPQQWNLSTTAAAQPLPGNVSAANTVNYTIVDGGAFDADGAVNGVIVESLGIGFGGGLGVGVQGARIVPASDRATQLALLLLLALGGGLALRRRV
jgi:hypothetical protein